MGPLQKISTTVVSVFLIGGGISTYVRHLNAQEGDRMPAAFPDQNLTGASSGLIAADMVTTSSSSSTRPATIAEEMQTVPSSQPTANPKRSLAQRIQAPLQPSYVYAEGLADRPSSPPIQTSARGTQVPAVVSSSVSSDGSWISPSGSWIGTESSSSQNRQASSSSSRESGSSSAASVPASGSSSAESSQAPSAPPSPASSAPASDSSSSEDLSSSWSASASGTGSDEDVSDDEEALIDELQDVLDQQDAHGRDGLDAQDKRHNKEKEKEDHENTENLDE